MKKFMVASAVLFMCLLAHAVQGAEGFRIYGFSLDDSIEDAIKNGIEKGMKVQSSYVPEKYAHNSSVKKTRFQYVIDFMMDFDWMERNFGISPDVVKEDLRFVDKNIRTLMELPGFPLYSLTFEGAEYPRIIMYYFKQGERLRCYEINICGGDDLRKDIRSFFEERYGEPKFFEEARENKRNPALDNLGLTVGGTIMEVMAEQRKANRVYFWQIGQQYATDGMIVNPDLEVAAYKDVLAYLNKLYQEQENVRKAKENEESRKRKSLM